MKKLAAALSLVATILAGASGTARADESLSSDEFLFPGQRLTASACFYRLIMQGDGNLVAYGGRGTSSYVWDTDTVGRGYFVAMQSDGNAVMYDWNGSPIWSSDTWGHPGSVLDMQNDGNVVVYAPNGTPLWASDTDGQSLGQTPCNARSITTQLERGYDRPGGDYAAITMARAWEVDCAYQCSQDTQCQAFTYVSPGIQGPNAICYLKSSVPGAYYYGTGVDSGRILRD